MWYWAMYVRLRKAINKLDPVRTNVLPRLEAIRKQLNMEGAIWESYEIQSIMSYLDRLNREACQEMVDQYHMIGRAFGQPAPRTTPLLYTATEDDIQTS